MDARNDAIIACDLAREGSVSQIRLIGKLDPKQAMTFELVTRLNGADAGSLMKKFGEEEKTLEVKKRALLKSISKNNNSFEVIFLEMILKDWTWYSLGILDIFKFSRFFFFFCFLL